MDFSNWTAKDIATVIVALIGFLSGIISIIVSSLSSRSITKMKHEMDMERDKSLEHIKRYLNLRMKGGDREFNAFQEMLSHVQLFRDNVKMVIKSPKSFNEKTLAEELNLKTLKKCYANNQILFNEFDRKLAHSLKESCNILAKKLSQIVSHDKRHTTEFLNEIIAAEQKIKENQSEFRERGIRAIKKLTDEIDYK